MMKGVVTLVLWWCVGLVLTACLAGGDAVETWGAEEGFGCGAEVALRGCPALLEQLPYLERFCSVELAGHCAAIVAADEPAPELHGLQRGCAPELPLHAVSLGAAACVGPSNDVQLFCW